MLVADAPGLAVVVEAVAKAPLVAFDLEFDTRDRLVPALCLVQVAWPSDAPDEPIVALVDPLAVDVGPLIAALAGHGTVVAHAPRQDLGLLAAKYGATFPGLVDTQLMAAFAGIGEQIGLAPLVAQLVGATLDKDQQWTAWAKRPLTDAQLRYAADDVRYLPRIYGQLATRLGDRVTWVRDETAQVGAAALASVTIDPDEAWREVGGVRHLDGKQMAALAVLAAWRQRTSVALDRPLPQILADKQLVELARARAGADALRQIKTLRDDADAIADAIANAPPMEPAKHRAPSMRAQRWAELLYAIANVIADRTGISARLLATRTDAEAVARAVDEGSLAAARALPAFATWRGEVLGPVWEAWLTGRLAVVGDPDVQHGIRLVPIGTVST